MRNFTLLAVALILATSSAIAAPQRNVQFPKDRAVVRQTERRHAAPQQQAPRKAVKGSAARKAPAGAIVTPPAGKLYENMIVALEGYAPSWFGISYTSTDAGYINLVEAEDGTLYIQNLTPYLSDDELYWIKAEKVDDDGNYVIHKQPAGYYAYYDLVDYITRLEYYEDDETATYVEAANTDITLKWKDGVLTTTGDFNGYGDVIFGTVYEWGGDVEWNGDGYYNFSAEPQTDTYTAPSSLATVEEYVVKYQSDGEPAVEGVKVAFEGSSVYLKLYDYVPGWIKGEVNGDKITIEGTQYLGIDSYYQNHAYAHAAKHELAYYEDEDDPDYSYYYDNFTEILDQDVLTYDAATRTITSANAITIDAAKNDIYYAAAFVEPVFQPFVEVPALPADPDVTYFENYDEDYGYGIADFSVPTVDVNGEYINPEKLYYTIYIDDEVFEFEADEYEDLDETLVEVPVTFDNGYDITSYYGDREIAFYFSIADNIGVQSIYKGGGETHKSNIVMYNVNTDDVEVIPVEDSIRTRISAARTLQVTDERYHDVTGRTVNANAKGLVIKTVRLADGTSRSYKVVRK